MNFLVTMRLRDLPMYAMCYELRETRFCHCLNYLVLSFHIITMHVCKSHCSNQQIYHVVFIYFACTFYYVFRILLNLISQGHLKLSRAIYHDKATIMYLTV